MGLYTDYIQYFADVGMDCSVMQMRADRKVSLGHEERRVRKWQSGSPTDSNRLHLFPTIHL